MLADLVCSIVRHCLHRQAGVVDEEQLALVVTEVQKMWLAKKPSP